eukprot:gene27009-33666_t
MQSILVEEFSQSLGFDPDFTEYPINSYVLLIPPEGNRPKLSPRKKGPTDPKTIAMDDAQEYLIESVLSHRGDRNRRTTMEFLVKWQGYSDDANTWEPYSELRDTEQLLAYLRANRLRSLIPIKHR